MCCTASLALSEGLFKRRGPRFATGTQINLTSLQGMAATPDSMIDRLNATMMPGTLSASDKQAIAAAINSVPATDPIKRARTAVYLVASSPQYNVTR